MFPPSLDRGSQRAGDFAHCIFFPGQAIGRLLTQPRNDAAGDDLARVNEIGRSGPRGALRMGASRRSKCATRS
jgi:hypothetical protein